MILGSAQVISFAATSTVVDLYEGSAALHGWTFLETTGTTAATLELFDGPLGVSVVIISLRAGQSTRDWLTGAGIYIRTGLYVRVLAGTVRGSLWYRPSTGHEDHAPLDVHGLVSEVLDALADQ